MSSDKIMVNDAEVITTNFSTAGGVIHGINKVMSVSGTNPRFSTDQGASSFKREQKFPKGTEMLVCGGRGVLRVP